MAYEIVKLAGDETRGVVTIFCCGTASGESYHDQFAVPYLYAKCASQRKAILNGPGGGPIKIVVVKNRLDWLQKQLGMRRTGTPARTKRYQLLRKAMAGINKVRGSGTRDNVQHAITFLQAEKEAQGFHTINLIGWSRGGVTCTMLAHKIQEIWQELGAPKVNIFAYDPVAGVHSSGDSLGIFNEFRPRNNADPKKLPACVKSYRAVLHENIVGTGKDTMFVCSIPTSGEIPSQPNTCEDYRLIPLPGNHADSCTLPSAAKAKGKAIGKLGLRLATDFLVSHGTLLEAIPEMKCVNIPELYAEIQLNYSSELEAGPTPYRRKKVRNSFRQHPFYVNAHHEKAVFAKNFRLWKWIDDISSSRRDLSPAELEELVTFVNELEFLYPNTVTVLRQLLLLPEDLDAVA